MKNTKKVMLAAVGALLTGFGSVALSMKSNDANNDTVLTNTNNISLVNNNTGYNLVSNAASATATKGTTSSGFDFSSMIVEGIQRGGANLIGSAISGLAESAFNAVLKEMGFDTRSVTEKNNSIKSKDKSTHYKKP